MNRTQKALYITISILLFQITRNISTSLYVGILFLSYGWLYVVYFYGNRSITAENSLKFRPVALIFLFSLIWIPFISLLNMDPNEHLISLQRFLVTFPFILFCYMYRGFNLLLAQKVLRIFTIFMVIAGLTIPFQIVFGPISFFADSSFRGELVRYASLAGSLAALGTLGCVSLAILLFSENLLFTRKKRIILIMLTILCMLMTLQKAAVVNMIICLVFYMFFYGKISLFKKIIYVMGFGILLYGLYYFMSGTDLANYIDSTINYTFARTSLGVEEDLIKRLWELPSRVVYYHNMNALDYILGIGFPALAGTMGNPQFPMAHNNYFDLVFSGGFLHLISYLYLLIRIPLKVAKKKNKGKNVNSIDRCYSVSILLMLINMLIGAATFYQPISAVITFFIIFSYDQVNNSIEKRSAINHKNARELPVVAPFRKEYDSEQNN